MQKSEGSAPIGVAVLASLNLTEARFEEMFGFSPIAHTGEHIEILLSIIEKQPDFIEWLAKSGRHHLN